MLILLISSFLPQVSASDRQGFRPALENFRKFSGDSSDDADFIVQFYVKKSTKPASAGIFGSLLSAFVNRESSPTVHAVAKAGYAAHHVNKGDLEFKCNNGLNGYFKSVKVPNDEIQKLAFFEHFLKTNCKASKTDELLSDLLSLDEANSDGYVNIDTDNLGLRRRSSSFSPRTRSPHLSDEDILRFLAPPRVIKSAWETPGESARCSTEGNETHFILEFTPFDNKLNSIKIIQNETNILQIAPSVIQEKSGSCKLPSPRRSRASSYDKEAIEEETELQFLCRSTLKDWWNEIMTAENMFKF
jgi:hypothetical protein